MIIKKDHSFELVPTKGPCSGKGIPFAVKVCPTPTCICEQLELRLGEQPADQETGSAFEPQLEFVIDVGDWTVGSTRRLSRAETERLHSFMDQVDNADRMLLQQVFNDLKQEVIMCGSFDQVPEEWSEDIDMTEFVPFGEAFPRTRILEFRLEGSCYEVLDYYCLKVGCDCQEAELVVVRRAEEGLEASDEMLFAVRFNLLNGSFHPYRPSDAVEAARLLPLLLKEHPDLCQTLMRRYQRARQLIQEKPPKPVAAKPKPAVAAPKCGRNDPCPCGSGKKFKKCCGG